ncbi:MAG: hypothetical protein Q9222_006104 [Ikaeria aurantiellina]
MAILDDVEVRVVSKATKQALHEYDDPKPAAAVQAHSVLKYVQAEEGMDFQVEVYFEKEFQCWDVWGIEIGINIDGGVVNYYKRCSQERVKTLQELGEPILLDSVRHVENSQHSRVGFRFGLLKINEDLEAAQDALDSQATQLGSIRVNVQRVNRKRRLVSKLKASCYKPLATLEQPRKAGAPTRKRGKQGEWKVVVCQSEGTAFVITIVLIKLMSCQMEVDEASGIPEGVIAQPSLRSINEQETAARIERLEQQLKESQEQLRLSHDRTAAMMQSFMGGFSTFMQTASPTSPTTAAASIWQPRLAGVKREHIKDEDNDETSVRSKNGGSRATKRTKTVIELD